MTISFHFSEKVQKKMTYTPHEKRTYEAMYEHTSRHGVKRALVQMAQKEDARTILEALTHISERRAARWLARLLTND